MLNKKSDFCSKRQSLTYQLTMIWTKVTFMETLYCLLFVLSPLIISNILPADNILKISETSKHVTQFKQFLNH